MSRLSKDVRKAIEKISTKHFIYAPSASIYGGVGGLYDFGPLGCKLKNNILSFWRSFFVLKENMQEIETATLTPEIVLRASGHVEKFQDLMVKDEKTQDCFRADHLIEDRINALLDDKKLSESERKNLEKTKNNVNGMAIEQISECIRKLEIVSPTTGNALSEPYYFNLMFSASIGPTGKQKGFLRPETAQGIFVNFKKLLDESGGRLPFAAAQIGTSYRNEIAPRSGLLRVREFTMAEIEHFCAPDAEKKHKKFGELNEEKIKFWKKDLQIENKDPDLISVKSAVESKIVANETLGFYIAKTYEFLVKIGVKPDYIRFRQHLKTEMAHYATDCWDAEILTSYGWIECVGLADRACYDLSNHSEFSKTDLGVFVPYDKPKTVIKKTIKPNVALLGKTFKTLSKNIIATLNDIGECEIDRIEADLNKSGKSRIKIGDEEIWLEKDMVLKIGPVEEVKEGYTFIPSVVEPSFGIGRIMYALLEHSLNSRAAETDGNDFVSAKQFLAFNALVAPIKCLVTPLSSNSALKAMAKSISQKLVDAQIYPKLDCSNTSVGRKYVRADEKGVLLCVTIDFDSLNDNTFTIRYRDNMEQIRVDAVNGISVIRKLLIDGDTWHSVAQQNGLIPKTQ